jgi:hypothetical protein
MRIPRSWTLLAALAASLMLEPTPVTALEIPDLPGLASPSRTLGTVRASKKKRKRRPKRGRVQALGGACVGTSVITATDELGGPIFPRSITPVTTQSFLFTDSVHRIFSPPEAALRVLALGEDPPMFTVEAIDLRHLVLEPQRGTVVGAGTVGGTPGIVRCRFPSQADCTVVHPLIQRPIFDIAPAGDDVLAVVTTDGAGNDVTRLIVPDGDESALLEPQDIPAFFERSVAVLGDTAFVGGYLSLEDRSAVFAVPLDGGPVREEVSFAPGDGPARMTVLGPDLVIALAAHVANDPSDAGQSVPSRVIRVHFDGAGSAVSFDDVPVDVPGFVNITDIEALDGQLFAVDSRNPTNGEWYSPATGEMLFSGRILRICPQ